MFKKLAPVAIISMISLPSLLAAEGMIKKVPTIEEFNKKIEENDFLKQHRANQKMDSTEQSYLENALKYEHSSGGGIINRPINEFKGNTLVVGGGKKGGFSSSHPDGHNLGITNIEKDEKHIKEIQSGKWDGKYGGMTGIKLDSEENKQKAIKEVQDNIDSILDKYYTVNLEKETEPDLIASITNINDMSSIPDGYFENIIVENVDTLIWLNPNIFSILERITKPGGTISLDGVTQPRLLVAAFADTKWSEQLNKQVEEELIHQHWGLNTDRLAITLSN